jgi:predicted transposase YbfD/YdcC
MIIDSGNHYLAALKGNQPTLYHTVRQQFVPHQTVCTLNKGHGRIEKRTVSICPFNCTLAGWTSITTAIRVESQRITKNQQETETRYYISDLEESATDFSHRIRGYWGVENKVHYCKDVTLGEDKSRIRTDPLPQIWSIARNLTLNLYRDGGFNNMAQAKRKSQFGLKHILSFFRMK